MLEIKRTTLPLSELIQSPDYASLIKPSLLPELRSPSDLTRWIAAEAWMDGKLAALALAEIYPLNRIGKLRSLVIHENFTGKGIWRPLFTFMQERLSSEEKMRGMEWIYDQESPSAPAMESILASLGWAPPLLYLIRFHFDADSFNPPWLNRTFPLPANMRYFPWKDLLPQDRDTINYLSQQGRFPPYLSPLYKEETIDLETSVGLRKEGLLVGWSLTRRPDPSTILYSSLYIDSGLLYGGYGIQLLLESIRRHKKLPVPHALFEISLREIDPTWLHFVNKRLLPYAVRVERIKQAFRIFHGNP